MLTAEDIVELISCDDYMRRMITLAAAVEAGNDLHLEVEGDHMKKPPDRENWRQFKARLRAIFKPRRGA